MHIRSFVCIAWFTLICVGPVLGEEPPAKAKAELVISMEKSEWKQSESPKVMVTVKNDTDEPARFLYLFHVMLELDEKKYVGTLPIPTLGGDGDWVKFPPRSETPFNSLRLNGKNYITMVSRYSQERPVPLELAPGEHALRIYLGGTWSNQIQFTVLPQ